MQTQIHKIHQGPDLGEAIAFPFIIFLCLAMGPTPKGHFVSRLPTWESQIF